MYLYVIIICINLIAIGGSTWENTSAPNATWYGITSDSTGTYLAAVVNGGGIYISTSGS